MHKLTVNRARIDFTFEPATPLLVKSGDKGAELLHPERPQLMCVRTDHRTLGETVYVPGSSLKGVVRAGAERVLRSLELPCCDPMNEHSPCHRDANRRGDAIAKERGARVAHPMGEVHAMLCLACRTFGSQALASRTAFADAYPTSSTTVQANRTETRNGVSLDRQTGGPARGKLFEMEVVVRGRFETSIHLSNYELWQLGLVGVVLRDLHEGFLRMGSGKSRGLGRVELELGNLTVDQSGDGRAMRGVGLLRPDLVEPYGLLETTPTGPEGDATVGALGRRLTWFGDSAVRSVLDAAADAAWPSLLARRGRA